MSDLKFMVCPHDTASNPDKWFQLAQYLSKHLSAAVKFSQSIDFAEYHQQLTEGALIYANPQDSLRLIKEHDYIPIARSSNLFDEIVFIASLGIDAPTMNDLLNSEINSVNSMMVTRVGVKHLLDNELAPKAIRSQASWMAVVKSIYRDEGEFGMVYKDFYDGLNSLTKKGFTTLEQTQDGTIYHSVLVSSDFKEVASDIQSCLVEMSEKDERAKEILQELGIDKFITVNSDDILQFEELSTLGNELMVSDV